MSAIKLAEALSKTQSEIEGAKKDSTNPHFNSRYADLASVWEAIREPMTKNGLSVAQYLDTNDHGQTFLITKLMHTSGEEIVGRYPIFLDAQNITNPQRLGSAVTYARRYALSAMLGVAPEDDDGNEASKPLSKPVSNFPTHQEIKKIIAEKPQAADTSHINPTLPPEIATYRITIGRKYKGKTFDEVGPGELASFCKWLRDTGNPKGETLKMLDLADEYLSGVDYLKPTLTPTTVPTKPRGPSKPWA